MNIQQTIKASAVFVTCILIFCGKNDDFIGPFNDKGQVSLKIVAQSGSPFAKIVDSAVVQITASDIITIVQQLTIKDTVVTGTVTGIPAGKNRLFTVTVFDSLHAMQYRGSAIANVIADSIVCISINLVRISGSAIINGTVVEYDSIPRSGLVAYYPFNGNAKDESGKGNDGTVYGATLSSDRFGKESSAYNLNGIDQYISCADNQVLHVNQVTLTAWIKVNGYSSTKIGGATQQFVIFKRNSLSANFEGYAVYLYGPPLGMVSIMASSSGTQTAISTISQMDSLQWHFIVAIGNESEISMYVDGKLEKRAAKPYPLDIGNRPLFIGRTGEWHDGYFNGKIDDIRIYNRVLSEQEILALYHEGGWAGK